MTPRLRIVLIATVILLAALQLVPIERSNPPVTQDVGAPPTIAAILKRSCYNCHANTTVWPWYSRVAPVSFLLAYDVNHGREHLNFSTWDVYDRNDIVHIAEEIEEVILAEEMPPWFYVALHSEAKLSAADREALVAWAQQLAAPASVTDTAATAAGSATAATAATPTAADHDVDDVDDTDDADSNHKGHRH